jgi:hypothetical protein
MLGYGGFGDDRTWTLTHSFSTGKQWLNLFLTMRETARPGQPTDKELNERIEIRRRISDEWDMALRFEQRVDLDKDKYTGDNFYYALDRTPEMLFSFRPRSSGFFRPNIAIGWLVGASRNLSGLVSRFKVSLPNGFTFGLTLPTEPSNSRAIFPIATTQFLSSSFTAMTPPNTSTPTEAR